MKADELIQMKALLERYFLLLSGKKAMKGNIDLGSKDLINIGPGHKTLNLHAHWKYFVNATSTAEVSTSSTTFVKLMETQRKDFGDVICPIKIGFTHAIKNEGELASRGSNFLIKYYDDGGEWFLSGADFRWTDALKDYKVMSVIINSAIMPDGDVGFRVYWAVDDPAYPCWSKNRFLVAEHLQFIGNMI